MTAIIIMGVSGCGKSSVGKCLSEATGMPFVEGDDHHSPANRAKMQRGIALNDADREGWLTTLVDQIRQYPKGVVVTCSALKATYRQRLRTAGSDVRFAFLEIEKAEAQKRVTARAAEHFFSTSLVDNQFATLESPVGEPGVLTLDATMALKELQTTIGHWLTTGDKSP
jgi:gluconokinase